MMKPVFFFSLLLLLSPVAKCQNLMDAIGCYNMHHSMDITKSGLAIQLHRNGTFSFKDYNDLQRDYEILRGKWEQRGAEIILKFNDRPLQQTFTLRTDRSGKWMLIRPGFELRKEDPEDCRQ